MNEFTSHISKTHVVPICCNMGVHSGSEFIMHKYVFGVPSSLDSSASLSVLTQRKNRERKEWSRGDVTAWRRGSKWRTKASPGHLKGDDVKAVAHSSQCWISGPHAFQALSWGTNWIKYLLVWIPKALPLTICLIWAVCRSQNLSSELLSWNSVCPAASYANLSSRGQLADWDGSNLIL